MDGHDRKAEQFGGLSLADEILEARPPLVSEADLVSDYQDCFAGHRVGVRVFAPPMGVQLGESGVYPEGI